MSANIEVNTTLHPQGVNHFKKAFMEMGEVVTKLRKTTALTSKELRHFHNESRTLRQQLDSFKSTVEKTGQTFVKIRQDATGTGSALRKHGNEIRKLGKDYKDLENIQNATLKKGNRMGDMIKKTGGVIGKIYNAGKTVTQPIKEQMDWAKRIDNIILTRLPKSTQQQYAKMREVLVDAINAAGSVGGKRDDIAEGLDALIGSFSPEMAAQFLPFLNTAAVTNGVSAVDLAGITPFLKKFNLQGIDEYKQAFNMMVAASQAGNFKLEDMLKALPSWMEIYQESFGMSGIDALTALLSSAQANMLTTSNANEVSDNMSSAYSQLASPEIRQSAQKEYGINLEAAYLDARKRGVDPVTEMVGSIQKFLEKNQDYRAIQQGMSNAKTPEEAQAYAVQAENFLQNSQLNKLFDQATLKGFSALMNHQYMGEVGKTIMAGKDNAIENQLSMIENTAWRTGEITANKMAEAKANVYQQIEEILQGVMNKINEYANTYPGLTSAIMSVIETVQSLGVVGAGAVGAGVAGLAGIIGSVIRESVTGVMGAVSRIGVGISAVLGSLGTLLTATPAAAGLAATGSVILTGLGAGFSAGYYLNKDAWDELWSAREKWQETNQWGKQQTDFNRARAASDMDEFKAFANVPVISRDEYKNLSQAQKDAYLDQLHKSAIFHAAVAQMANEMQPDIDYSSGYPIQDFTRRNKIKNDALLESETRLAAFNNLPAQYAVEDLLNLSKQMSQSAIQPLTSYQDVSQPQPQVQDNSQRHINLTLQVTDERQIIPLVERTIERLLNQERMAARAALFDNLEAVS